MTDPEGSPETAPGGRRKKIDPDKLVQSAELPGYRFLLYEGALHPELFSLKARRVLNGGLYEIEVWLMRGSHLVRFEHARHCSCELLTDRERHLPDTDMVKALHCTGEHEQEHRFPQNVNHITWVQMEVLSEKQYAAALEEFSAFLGNGDNVTHAWRDEAGSCLSVVEVQQHNREVHIQAYHFVAWARMVLRSQSIFELTHAPAAAECSR